MSIAAIVAAQTAMRKAEEARRKKKGKKPEGITFGRRNNPMSLSEKPGQKNDFREPAAILTEEARKEWTGGSNPLTREEIGRIATRTADEVMERIAERQHDSLLLHSIGPGFGNSGIVVDEAKAKATPCRCYEYKSGKKLFFSPGVVGALSDEQETLFCKTVIPLESPGIERRMENWGEAVKTCKAEIAGIPKGERLVPWLSCMSRELSDRGVKG